MKRIEVVSSTPGQSVAVRRYECDFMDIQDLRSRVQFFKKVKAGYRGGISFAFWSAYRETLFLLLTPPVWLFPSREKDNPGRLDRKESLMIVWCQNKSKWPFILITKPSRKRLFLSFVAVLWHIRYRDLHHHDGLDFPSFLLKTRPARHPVQYFFLSAFCSGRKKQSQKRAFKGKYQSCSISGMGDIEKTPVFDMIGGYRCLLFGGCGDRNQGTLYWFGRFMDCDLVHMSLFRQMCILRKPLIVRDKKE